MWNHWYNREILSIVDTYQRLVLRKDSREVCTGKQMLRHSPNAKKIDDMIEYQM